jgi:flagellar basal-body rod modification protein FlgD
MSTVLPTGTTGSTGASGSTASSSSTNATLAATNPMLDKNAFLKLMMVQLQHQDPLDPNNDPTQYLQQLAQYTTLEQTTNIAQSSAQAASAQSNTAALALLGHTVTYLDSTTGATVTGSVQSVDLGSSGPTLTVNGVTGIDPGWVTQVS